MKPLCLIPWTNIDIAPRGDIAPCCKYQGDVMNIKNNTIQDYMDSEKLKILKQKMLDNIWPDECIRCKSE